MIERTKVVALVFLTLTAAAAGGLISLSHELSSDRIAANQRERRLARLRDVLGPVRFDNDVEQTGRIIDSTDQLAGRPLEVFHATLRGATVATVFSVTAPNGYNGPLELLIGIASDGAVTGVRVSSHRETPGLGDAVEVEKSDWIRAFDGTRLGDPPVGAWRVSKDGGYFDAITGATVTPRAIVETVRNTLLYCRDHCSELARYDPADTER